MKSTAYYLLVWEKNMFGFINASRTFPVVRIDGTISSAESVRKKTVSYENLYPYLLNAFSFKTPVVGLAINSPGGSPTQAEEIANLVRDLCCVTKKKCVAFVEDAATSAAYYIACAASEIYVCENSLIGSIGVINSGFEFADAMKKLGIKRRLKTKGKYKAILDPFSPENPEHSKIIDEVMTDIYEHFISWVALNRGNRIKLDLEELASGRIWTGKRAVELGLADAIMPIHLYVWKNFGQHTKIKYLNAKRGFPAFLGMFDEFFENISSRIVNYFFERIVNGQNNFRL